MRPQSVCLLALGLCCRALLLLPPCPVRVALVVVGAAHTVGNGLDLAPSLEVLLYAFHLVFRLGLGHVFSSTSAAAAHALKHAQQRCWCDRLDSNQHALLRGILSPLCLPFHHGRPGLPCTTRTCDPRFRKPMLYPTELRAAWWADLELNQDSRHYEYPALPLSYRPRLYCYVHYTATPPACQPLNSHTEPHPELIDIEPLLNPY